VSYSTCPQTAAFRLYRGHALAEYGRPTGEVPQADREQGSEDCSRGIYRTARLDHLGAVSGFRRRVGTAVGEEIGIEVAPVIVSRHGTRLTGP